MFFKFIKLSKIQNLDKYGNKKLMVLIHCSFVAKLSIKILTMALIVLILLGHLQSSIKNDSNKCLCVSQVSILDIFFCWILFYMSLSKSPLPKGHSFKASFLLKFGQKGLVGTDSHLICSLFHTPLP
jgi:membrane-associated HD superfamily phosphohydrolase